MKKQIIILSLLMLSLPTKATTFIGEVTKVGQHESNQIIDAQTKQGIEFAKITIPQKNIQTYSDGNGNFELPPITVKSPLILNVEKEGYRPFSITINNNSSLRNPMKIEIAKSEVKPAENSQQLAFKGKSKEPSEFVKWIGKTFGAWVIKNPTIHKYSGKLAQLQGKLTAHMSTIGSLITSSVYVQQTLSKKDLDNDKRTTLAINQILCFFVPTFLAYTADSTLNNFVKILFFCRKPTSDMSFRFIYI